MKKILIVINAFFLLICASCTNQKNETFSNDTGNNAVDTVDTNTDKYEKFIYSPEFDALSDDGLVSYIEQSVYYNIVQTLPEQDYYIDNVEVKYISKEYIEELNYNSKSNIFFGYTLKEIENIYKDQKYIFTLENGETTVKLFEDYDDSFEKAIENIAIEENCLTEDGKVDVKKLSPLTYDSFNHDYIELGNIVGKAFSDGKKFSN